MSRTGEVRCRTINDQHFRILFSGEPRDHFFFPRNKIESLMYTDGTTGFTQAKCSLLGSDFLGHHCCILPALFHRRESLPSRCSESLHIASSWLYEWWLFGWSLMAGILKIKKKTRKKEAPLLWGETPHLCYVETEGKKERKKERREGRKKESVWCGVLCLTSPSYHVSYNEISLFKLSLCLKCFLVPNLVHSEQVSFSFIEVSLITRHFFFLSHEFRHHEGLRWNVWEVAPQVTVTFLSNLGD